MRIADDFLTEKWMENSMAEDKRREIDVTAIEVTEEYLKEKLYKIRGKRVLLDADLAEIYGYCKCQYKNDQKVENKNVHFPRSIPQLVFP